MKKTLSIALALIMLLLSFTVVVSAAKAPVTKADFKSNLAGLTQDDYEKFADLSGGNLVFRDGRVMVCNYANDLYFGEMKAGRTYYIYFEFDVADGYVFPENSDDLGADFTCEKGGSISYYHYVSNGQNEPNYLYICEKVTLGGNIIQVIFGKLADILLKLSAWSPY